ncbi:MAG: ankyrin repeat domain-containing protein [Pseudomonadota bacterium]
MSEHLKATDILHRYIDEELPEFFEVVLDNVNSGGNFGNKPIHVACVRGLLPEVRALLEGGADVNAIGELGNTPLHDAVGQGHIDVVKLLIQFGALSNGKNEFESTPFDIAQLNGRQDIVNILPH